jgi:hypothetical protein
LLNTPWGSAVHYREARALKSSRKPIAPKKKPESTLLGVAFDAEDGQTRITRGKDILLFGGSDETHAVMQETTIKVTEQLEKRGKRMADVSPRELRDIFEIVLK